MIAYMCLNRPILEYCDKRLLMIKVPDYISRIPQSLTEVNHWKGMLLTVHFREYNTIWLLY